MCAGLSEVQPVGMVGLNSFCKLLLVLRFPALPTLPILHALLVLRPVKYVNTS